MRWEAGKESVYWLQASCADEICNPEIIEAKL